MNELKRIAFALFLGLLFWGLMSVAVLEESARLPKVEGVAPTVEVRQAVKQKKLSRLVKKRQKRLAKKTPQKTTKTDYNYGEKTQLSAFLLCVFVGFLGVHRFYMGHYLFGLLELATLGCCGVLVIVDLVFICTNNLYTSSGNRLIPW